MSHKVQVLEVLTVYWKWSKHFQSFNHPWKSFQKSFPDILRFCHGFSQIKTVIKTKLLEMLFIS